MPHPVHGERIAYRPDIDGLRAVAVVPVILFHLGVPHMAGGYVGVDVFYVISGFLITSLIAPDVAAGRFSILQFYERRIRRIFPALFAVTACALPFAVALLLPTALRHFGDSLAGLALFASNFVFWHEAGYFDAASHSKPLLHTWSLAVEEQFYIVFPLLLVALARWAKAGRRLVLAALGVISFAGSVWLTKHDTTAAFYGPHVRAWELMAGCLLALSPRPNLGAGLSNLGAALGLVLILYAVFAFTSATVFPGWNGLFPVLGTALVIRFGEHSLLGAGPLLRARPMMFIGKISYSAYLWHWPIIVFATYYLVRDLQPVEMAAVGLATFALATASWRFVEQPARKTGLSRPSIFAVAATAIALTFAVGLGLHASRGLPARYAGEVEPAGLEAYGVDVCHMWRKPTSAWSEAACTFPAANKTAPRVFLWGDSFAAHYFPGLRALQQTVPFTLVHASMSSCAPVPHDGPADGSQCEAFNRRIRDLIVAEKPRAVIWAGRWDGGISERDRKAATTLLQQLHRDGIAVIVTGESPVYDVPVPQRHAMAVLRGQQDDAYVPANHFRTEPALAALASDTGAQFFAPRDRLCHADRCAIANGGLLYWDDAHFSARGSALMAQAMAPQLRAALAGH